MSVNNYFVLHVERTIKNYQHYQGEDKLSQLINSISGILLVSSQIFHKSNPTFNKVRNKKLSEIPCKFDISTQYINNESNPNFNFGKFLDSVRNGFAHAHVIPYTNDGERFDCI
jgi:hypothetical protein